MYHTTKFRAALAKLVIFYAVVVRETRSGLPLTFGPYEETGFFESDPEGPTIHLPESEVVLRLCFNGRPPELINVRFGDGETLDDFPINVTTRLPVYGTGPLPDVGMPVSGEDRQRVSRAVDKSGTRRRKRQVSNKDPRTHENITDSRSEDRNGGANKNESGLATFCHTVIRHSYTKPGLYRIDAEIVRPRNLTLTFFPGWVQISPFEFLVGQVLLFNQIDRLVTPDIAHVLAVVPDVQLPLLAEVDFGDGTPTKRVELSKSAPVPEWAPNVPWLVLGYRTGTCDHGYAYPGTYTITLKVSRRQPTIGTAKPEMVTAKTTVTVETFAQRVGDHLLFYQTGVRIFPREDFEVVAMVERPLSNSTRVDLDFGDGTPAVSVELQKTDARPDWTRLNETEHYYWALVKHRFSLSGAFQMKMVIRLTGLSESRVVYFCPVVVYDFLFDVKDVRLLLPVVEGQSQTKVTIGESVTFTVLIRSRPEANLAVVVDFGDGTERQNVNYTSVALASIPREALYDLPDANHVGFARHMYLRKGVFEAKVFATNVDLKRFREATFTAVTAVPVVSCSTLPVWIGGSGVQRVYGRWEQFMLQAYVAPGCEDIIGGGEGRPGGGGRGRPGGGASTTAKIITGGEGAEEIERESTGREEMVREGRRRREKREGTKEGREEGGGEVRTAGRMEEEVEAMEDEGISGRQQTGGLGGGGGGGEEGGAGGGAGGDKDGVRGIQVRRGEGRIGGGLLAEWRLVRIGPFSVPGTTWPTYPKSTTFEIQFPPYSLPVGEYEFHFELTQLSLDDGRPLGKTTNRTTVIITSSNFRVDVEPEIQRIDLSSGNIAVFEAIIIPELEDWDVPDELVFHEWFCVTQKPSDPDLDLSDQEQDPGCYGDGSKLNETAWLIGIEPKRLVFKKLPAAYYVYARVTRSDRRVTSLPAELWLDAKSQLNVTIVCFINCGTFLSADEALALSYTCSNCKRPSSFFPQLSILSSSSYSSSSSPSASSSISSSTSSSSVSFSSSSLPKDRSLNSSWTLEPSGKGIDLSRDSLTGSHSDWLIIPGLVFYENLTSENRTYHIKVAVTDRLQSQGVANYTVSVSARLKPSFLARGALPSRASSLLIFSQRPFLLCAIITGILPQMTLLRPNT